MTSSNLAPTENAVDVTFGLFGAGGFAREVMPLVQSKAAAFRRDNPGADVKVFFVQTEPEAEFVNDVPVISEAAFLALNPERTFFNIAIANSRTRERIANSCLTRGLKSLNLAADNVVCFDTSPVGEGAMFCAFSMVTANARIGRFFQSNIYAYVAHDCVIGDFVTFAPRVCCNGNVHIHDHAYIGTGAVLKQGTPEKPLVIGEGAVIGMGAVVTKDVPPHTTVVGNPAKPMERR